MRYLYITLIALACLGFALPGRAADALTGEMASLNFLLRALELHEFGSGNPRDGRPYRSHVGNL